MGLVNYSLKHQEPLFGLDIGHSSMKVMQLDVAGKARSPSVLGYGTSYRYEVSSIQNGAIVDYEALSKAMHNLFEEKLLGSISTRRVACTIPMSNSYSRPIKLPAMEEEDLQEAIQLEAQQYIPVSPENLYMDYDVVRRDETNIEVLLVATPKNIVDSYMAFLHSV